MTTNELQRAVQSSKFSSLLPQRSLVDFITPLERLLGLEGVFSVRDRDGILLFGDLDLGAAEITEPIIADGETIAFVGAYESDDRTAEALSYLAHNLSALAAETARRREIGEEVLARYDELNLIYDLVALISRHDLTQDEIMHTVLEETNRIVRAEAGIIYLFDDNKSELRAISFFGERSDERFWQGRTRELALSTLYAYDNTQLFESGRVICVPLRYNEERLGALVLMHEGSDRVFNANDVNLLTTLSHSTSLFIQAASLYQSLAQRHKDLEATLAELKATRDDLSRAERLSLIGQTVGGLVHDMRNPLNIVMGYAGLLQEGGLSEAEVIKFAGQIITFVDTFSSMAQEILDYARDDENVDRQVVDLAEYMDTIETLLRPPGLKRGAKIVMDCAPIKGYSAFLDRQRFSRVFQNLVNNAVDAIEENGGSRVLIQARPTDDGKIQFSVSDDGPGVPPEIVDRLFEPLTTTKSRGTGLGLAIVRRMVLIHEGDIYYTPSADGGASFVVTLPQALTRR
jgi:signal transduction histidine kinase